MSHVVLLGDSIFDNKAYVSGGPDVIEHLRGLLSHSWTATLGAIDGDTTQGVAAQLSRMPAGATHQVISAGGNDALMQAHILIQNSTTVADALHQLANVTARFEANYIHMLGAVLQRELPTAVCTIYDPRFDDAFQQKVAKAALCLFNDAIMRAAFTRGLPVIDLRLVCNEYSDYANEIEPGIAGGAKIASAICRLLTQHDFSTQRSAIFV
jgi:hypothetical protein